MGLCSELVRRGVTEALLQDELRRRPGILHTPAPRPLIVVGLSRTGTTLLHALLGCDPAALLAALPEAMVVQTHRDLAVALASWCSLAAVLGNTFSEQIDLAALGRRWLDFWAIEMDRALAARAADPARVQGDPSRSSAAAGGDGVLVWCGQRKRR